MLLIACPSEVLLLRAKYLLIRAAGTLSGSCVPLPPSPPAEKASARQDQAGQSSTGDASDESARGGAMSKGEQPQAPSQSLQKSFAARLTPGRGDFSFRDFGHAPSDKNLSKNGSAHKGGSLCVKAFCEKIFWCGRAISLAALASA